MWGRDRKICPKHHRLVLRGLPSDAKRITDLHLEACRVMTNGDRKGQIFLSHPHTNNGFFFLVTTKYLICIGKT